MLRLFYTALSLLFFLQLAIANSVSKNSFLRKLKAPSSATKSVLSTLLVRGKFNPRDPNCPTGYVLCDNYPDVCAPDGNFCCDETMSCPDGDTCLIFSNLCCTSNSIICDGINCCDPGQECCKGSCCDNGDICCNDSLGGCCPSGHPCIPNTEYCS